MLKAHWNSLSRKHEIVVPSPHHLDMKCIDVIQQHSQWKKSRIETEECFANLWQIALMNS